MVEKSKANIKIAIYLANLPLAESYDLDPEGMLIGKRLVYDILPAEAGAIKLATMLEAEITAVAIGGQKSEELLRSALALGADKALHIGADDWPLDPAPQIIGEALKTIGQAYDLILYADTGNSISGSEVAIACGFALNRQVITGIYKVEKSPYGLLASRKLEKGKRQDIKLKLPCMLALLPPNQKISAPSLEAKLKGVATLIEEIALSYGLLCRKAKGLKIATEYWQPQKLAPSTKHFWQPSSNLSGGQRLSLMVQGQVAARHGKRVGGTPEECASEIINYLLKAGIIQKS